MTTPSRRFREFATAGLMATALAAISLTAAADDAASIREPGLSNRATEQVSARLAERIESTLATEIANDLRPVAAAAQSPTRAADAAPAVERRAAARERSRASAEERAQQHTRVFIAIRERPNDGVLVQ